jgi:hypothetical protein
MMHDSICSPLLRALEKVEKKKKPEKEILKEKSARWLESFGADEAQAELANVLGAPATCASSSAVASTRPQAKNLTRK